MKKSIIEGTLKDVDEELSEINISDYSLYLGEILPGEEVLGEMNDLEKRSCIWFQNLELKLNEAQKIVSSKPWLMNQHMEELELLLCKIRITKIKVMKSLMERYNELGPFGFRDNCLVVKIKDPKEVESQIQKLNELAKTMVKGEITQNKLLL